MQLEELVERAAKYDETLARDIKDYVHGRKYGLVYEASKPEFVRLWNKPAVKGDLVNILPPRGEMEDTRSETDSAETIYRVLSLHDGKAALRDTVTGEETEADASDIVPIAKFDQPIYAGLKETGRVERGGDKPYHVVINGENFHALQTLVYAYQGKVDCIYIDPPYNTGAKDWKYNNNYVGAEDIYRHSKWLTFMEDRLKLAKKLLNPKDSVLIVTIDEKEYLRLGLLLEQMFPEAKIQMVTSVINPKGNRRDNEFSRCEEYLYFVIFGSASICSSTTSMLREETKSDKSSVRWKGLLRSASNNGRRTARPNLFYPLYFDSATGLFQNAGETISIDTDRHSVEVPEGSLAVWPIGADGTELTWSLSRATFIEYQKEGYVRFGPFDGVTRVPYHLTSGQVRDVKSGKLRVLGRDADGALEISHGETVSMRPYSVWNQKSHSASEYGTGIVKSFLPGRYFPFPKSLYAVEDTLRFAVADKPNALIVDFFSGSGSTAHATMRLNRQDGGFRRCISVTNNEVGADEQEKFVAQGLRQGDPEWEQYGICEYITKPRIKAAITGLAPDGEPVKGDYKFIDESPISDGFEENAIFFDLEYLEPSVVGADLAFDRIAPILWMCGGCEGRVLQRDNGYALGKTYAVLFNPRKFKEFVEKVSSSETIHTVFIVTDSSERYRALCSELPDVEVKQLYDSYLRSFEINAIG